jgi:hypothetical protein
MKMNNPLPLTIESAKQHAARLAIKEPIGTKATHAIYTMGDIVYVRPTSDPAPDKADLYAYVQRWDENTVQIRTDGAMSDFIRF